MSPIKDLLLAYEALNEEGTFSAGDTLAGTVTFTLTKESEVKGLMVKAKGDADVRWSEGSGDSRKTRHDHKRYFKLKEFLIEENGLLLPVGVHIFRFTLQIPLVDMPSSFKGAHGKIVYTLEAKMSRSWRWPIKEKIELNFVSKSFPNLDQVMGSQSGTVDKKMGVFSKGEVQMTANVNTKVCSPGDTLSVVAIIHNSSSKTMRPKFSLHEKTVYRAGSSTKVIEKLLCKMVGENIAQNSEETVSCQLEMPADAIHTLHNCEIISVEHYLKVYLDISFAYDPEVVFPLVIVPSGFVPLQPGEAVGPYPGGAFGAPNYSDFPPPAFATGP
ncbi:arrestin domain-containing protein 3-like [Centropristis striata]|uniref:arrestin domain-containing protein 3-like n=1 Tax=Centropristis striata TaxID=184440 RepID=UPI0027E0E943|nr:arrestin domain-containing protein 3-like [Centropristis striata]